jgi:LCP family protein required for cell wall assembly
MGREEMSTSGIRLFSNLTDAGQKEEAVKPGKKMRERSRTSPRSRRPLFAWGLLLVVLLSALYLLAPVRVNLLLLGIDEAPPGTALGRSDAMIMISVLPLDPYVGILAIPRDLWLPIPGSGEDRISNAHYLAESEFSGSGSEAAIEVVERNFQVDIPYFVRFNFEDFYTVIDAMGGVDVTLPAPFGGYPAGTHHMDGEEALLFIRDKKGTADYFRLKQAQLFLLSAIKQIVSPTNWSRLPEIFNVFNQTVDTNLPLWESPRLGLAFLRAGTGGVDDRLLDASMVDTITLEDGSKALMPKWDMIDPIVSDIFGR